VLNLSAYGRSPRITHHGQLLRRGLGIDSATPAVVTDAIASAVWNIAVVNIVNESGVYVRDGAVVVNRTVIPISAIVALAGISVAIIDAAVVADVRTPIA
jgi:hypothetical protein